MENTFVVFAVAPSVARGAVVYTMRSGARSSRGVERHREGWGEVFMLDHTVAVFLLDNTFVVVAVAPSVARGAFAYTMREITELGSRKIAELRSREMVVFVLDNTVVVR